MPADALTYEYLSKELDSLFAGGVVSKITMPYRDEIILAIRNGGQTGSLLLSASPACPRAHVTERKFVNPVTAPAFLMHLRKHIGSAKVISIDTVPYERVLRLKLRSRNELGDEEDKILYAEIMGKYSNIILVNGDGKISDCIRKITPDISSKRQLLPGLSYLPAPPQTEKKDISHPDFIARQLMNFPGGRIAPFIIKFLCGLSPVTVNECVYRAIGRESSDRLTEEQSGKIVAAIAGFYDFSDARPCVMISDGNAVDFCIRPYMTVGNGFEELPSLSQAMERYYDALDRKNRYQAQAHAVEAAVKAAIKKTEKRLDEFTSSAERAADYADDSLYGELITANIYRIGKNAAQFDAENYYTGETVRIPLDPALSPQANAQRYYKRASKKKKTVAQARERITEALADAEYLKSVLTEVENGEDPAEIDGIRAELASAGFIRARNDGKKAKPTASSPITFTIGGFTVRTGKNNLQNDALTRASKPDDIWLHTQKIHGSHTLISSGGREVPPEVIRRAAQVCAYFSAARNSENVPVDYTKAKHVSKPSGARPGMVVYTDQKTVYVKPSAPDA